MDEQTKAHIESKIRVIEADRERFITEGNRHLASLTEQIKSLMESRDQFTLESTRHIGNFNGQIAALRDLLNDLGLPSEDAPTTPAI